MKVVLLLAAIAAVLFNQINGQYVASSVYLHTPLPCGTDFNPEANATALMTIAELNQNVTTGYEFISWELVYLPSGVLPVKLDIVAYSPSQKPSNQGVILTLASNPNGLQLGTNDVQNTFTLATLNAGRAAVGLPPAPVCDPKNACEPGPSTFINVADTQIFVLTYADGNVTSGFAQLQPDIPYPPPSDDRFYVSTFNGSFALPPTPALTGTNDDVTGSVFDNFDDQGTWGAVVLSTFNQTPTAKVAGYAIVTITNNVPNTILDLSPKLNFNDPAINDIGVQVDNAFTLQDLINACKTANITNPTEFFAATTVSANGQTYINYDKFEPEWVFDPNAVPKPPAPMPSPKKPAPKKPTPKKPAPKGRLM